MTRKEAALQAANSRLDRLEQQSRSSDPAVADAAIDEYVAIVGAVQDYRLAQALARQAGERS